MIEDRFVHYRTGYAAIDDEHLSLIKMCDSVLKLCRIRPTDAKLIKQSLVDISVRLDEHFVNEEQLMRDANYKFVASHCYAHGELRKHLQDLINREFDFEHIARIANDLEFVFFDHIDQYDMQIKLE
jgi:hemerythrin-like metal-binding protein